MRFYSIGFVGLEKGFACRLHIRQIIIAHSDVRDVVLHLHSKIPVARTVDIFKQYNLEISYSNKHQHRGTHLPNRDSPNQRFHLISKDHNKTGVCSNVIRLPIHHSHHSHYSKATRGITSCSPQSIIELNTFSSYTAKHVRQQEHVSPFALRPIHEQRLSPKHDSSTSIFSIFN